METEKASNSIKKKLSATDFFAMANSYRKVKPFEIQHVCPTEQSDNSEDDEEDDAVRIEPIQRCSRYMKSDRTIRGSRAKKEVLNSIFDRYKPISKRKSEQISCDNIPTEEEDSRSKEKHSKSVVAKQTTLSLSAKPSEPTVSPLINNSAPKNIYTQVESRTNGEHRTNQSVSKTAFNEFQSDNMKNIFIDCPKPKPDDSLQSRTIGGDVRRKNDVDEQASPRTSSIVSNVNDKLSFTSALSNSETVHIPAWKENLREQKNSSINTDSGSALEKQVPLDLVSRSNEFKPNPSAGSHMFGRSRWSLGVKSTDSGFSSTGNSSLLNTLFHVDNQSSSTAEGCVEGRECSSESVFAKTDVGKCGSHSFSSVGNMHSNKSINVLSDVDKENIAYNVRVSNDKYRDVKSSMDSSSFRDDTGMQSFTDVFTESGSFSEWNRNTDQSLNKSSGTLKTNNILYNVPKNVHSNSKSVTSARNKLEQVQRKTQSQSFQPFVPNMKNSKALGKLFSHSQQSIPLLLLPSHVILQECADGSKSKMLDSKEATKLSTSLSTSSYKKPSVPIISARTECTGTNQSTVQKCKSIAAVFKPSVHSSSIETSKNIQSLFNLPSATSQIKTSKDIPLKPQTQGSQVQKPGSVPVILDSSHDSSSSNKHLKDLADKISGGNSLTNDHSSDLFQIKSCDDLPLKRPIRSSQVQKLGIPTDLGSSQKSTSCSVHKGTLDKPDKELSNEIAAGNFISNVPSNGTLSSVSNPATNSSSNSDENGTSFTKIQKCPVPNLKSVSASSSESSMDISKQTSSSSALNPSAPAGDKIDIFMRGGGKVDSSTENVKQSNLKAQKHEEPFLNPSSVSDRNSAFTSPPKVNHVENLEKLLLQSKTKSRTLTVCGEVYNKQKCIGKGGSAKVYEAHSSSGEVFAIKVVQFADVEDEIAKGYLNEVNLLRQMKGCPYVVQLHEYELRDEDLYLVMERGDLDLDRILKTKKKLDKEEMLSYWAQMLLAVNAIHKAGIIHLDLKPSNFLIVKDKLKLIDFGIANKIQSDVTSITRHTQAGTVNYMAPEQLSNAKDPNMRRLSPKTDVWSLACILYYMIYQTLPYKHIRNEREKMLAIKSGEPIKFPDTGDSEMIQILKACLQFQPKQRPSIEDLLKHPCVQSFNASDANYQSKPKTPIRKFARQIKYNAINSPMAVAKIDKSIFSRRTQPDKKFPGYDMEM